MIKKYGPDLIIWILLFIAILFGGRSPIFAFASLVAFGYCIQKCWTYFRSRSTINLLILLAYSTLPFIAIYQAQTLTITKLAVPSDAVNSKHIMNPEPWETEYYTAWTQGKLKDQSNQPFIKNNSHKILILHFWATYCPPCKEEFPLWSEFIKKYAEQVSFIGISDESESDIMSFKSRHTIPFHLLSKSSLLPNPITTVPYTVIMDLQGNVISRIDGSATQELIQELTQIANLK